MATSSTAAPPLPEIQRLHQEQDVLRSHFTQANNTAIKAILNWEKMSPAWRENNYLATYELIEASTQSKKKYHTQVELVKTNVDAYLESGGSLTTLAIALFPTDPAAQSAYQRTILDSRRVSDDSRLSDSKQTQ